MGPGIKCSEGLQHIGIFQFGAHKCDAVAIYFTASADREVLYIFRSYPYRSFAGILPEGTFGINFFIRVSQYLSSAFYMNIYIGFQSDGAGHKYRGCREQHSSTTCPGARIDSLLYRGSIIRPAIARSAEIFYIED